MKSWISDWSRGFSALMALMLIIISFWGDRYFSRACYADSARRGIYQFLFCLLYVRLIFIATRYLMEFVLRLNPLGLSC